MSTPTHPLVLRDAELARSRIRLPQSAMPDHIASAIEVARRQSEASLPEREAELARKAAAEQQRMQTAKMRIWRDKFAKLVPRVAARRAFEPEMYPCTQAVLDWLADGCPHDLLLRSGVGAGKSTAAAVAALKWCEPVVQLNDAGDYEESPLTKEPSVSWLRPNALVSAIEHDYDEKAPKLYRRVIIDDLGRETRPDFLECFCELLDREDHTILVTTNMNKLAMREFYKSDIRLFDRLMERFKAFDDPSKSRRPKSEQF